MDYFNYKNVMADVIGPEHGVTVNQLNELANQTTPLIEELNDQRKAGVMIATTTGQVTAYALDALYDRGIFFVEPGETVYDGQVVGEHCKEKDIPVNVAKNKQLTNVRASGKDDAAKVRPARKMSLEATMEYIQADELVEICPNSIRIRKRLLKETDRKRDARKKLQ